MTQLRRITVAVAVTFAINAFADGPGLSLRIPDEAAPSGSTVQIKVEVTEPKPISTGRGKVRTRGVTNIQGIVLMNEGQDTYGLAIADDNGDLTFVINSPSNLFGTPADYPILGIAGTVAPASNGTTFPLSFDPDVFRGPTGAAYPLEVDNGTLTVSATAVTIGDVTPGSAVVPAGGVVRISGANFTPDTRIRIGESSIAEQRFINSSRIDIVLGQTTRMHGVRIRARNDGDNGEDRSESEYFSYERTTQSGATNDPIFSRVVPLFASIELMDATIDLPFAPRRTSGRRRSVRPSFGSSSGPNTSSTRAGFALQNLDSFTASVTVELLDGSGHVYAVNTLQVPGDRWLVREISEVFGSVSPPAALRIRSNVPIQMLGLVTDASSGTAAALPPH